ncbi:SMP-30/gluconolactonase/LRE family protein [Conexibacter stalactiti]|uniref:SMP-30/gluconolactonase/LRE family protein n=1 Tax=Conexibacter stalactiti TaxID=1940611 RepID=A0ABU4HZF9_9ACTN|nr:SMP-30/gluconolactonase/LRE family protein [Conexibacter stalactiti]MDW5598675.1 SMP-30/gluconolactonase/LRE family protein [Conexibacter stalactiti]MEC5039317.1 SMP-30/gluconolactonase/LRE family protein [Conexibacter stalactiti]
MSVSAEAAEPVLAAGAALAEGPRWDEAAGLLHWVDMSAGMWHRFDPARGPLSPRALGQRVSAIVPRTGGGHVAAVDGALLLLGERGVEQRRIAVVAPGAGVAPGAAGPPATAADLVLNDGACDARGRLWIGTASRAGRPDGALHRVEPDGAVHVARTGISISNGLGWSPDGTTLHHVDSATGIVSAAPFHPDTGALGAPRPLIEIDRRDGIPDGLAVAADGSIWLAIWGAGEVRRHDPDGRPRGAVTTPGAAQVTSCAIGGGRLWITTAREGLTPAQRADQPRAGDLFALSLDLPGQPAHAFAG